MMKDYLKKITPDREKLENNKVLKPVAHLLTNPQIWHFNRRSIAMGIAIGLFFGSFPIAGQMPLSALLAVFLRGNMPISLVATWISNPFTMPFIFTGNYYLGSWILGYDTVSLADMSWTLDAILNLGKNILIPLFFGSTVLGIVLAISSYTIIRVWWRIAIINHRRKTLAKRQKNNNIK